MKKSERIFLLLMFMLSLNIIFCSTAFAYIDPSTTTYRIQAIAGIAVAVGSFAVIYWRKAKKRINEKQELLLDFTTSKGDKRTATWQPSDNYACWQTCGMAGDDYSGFLLMPTYKDDEYFCIYYQC